MKLKIFKLTLPLLCSSLLLFSSCLSKPRYEGSGDLCGIIIDENNKPVKDFIVYCKLANPDKFSKDPGPVKTNESGLFVFYGLPCNAYMLSGCKNNYLGIEPFLYSFEDRTRIVCLQTRGYKSAITRAEELAAMGQTEEAAALVGRIACEKDSREELYIKAHQFLLSQNKDTRLSILNDLKNRNYKNGSFFTEYTKKLEEMMQ